MAIAKLSIDLEARLAGLQQGLDKAVLLSQQSAGRIDAAFAKVGTTLATLGASLSVGVVVSWLRATADGVDKLNDLADATGDTVENLSALEDIAARTGSSINTASDAVVKLNKALDEARKDPKSEAGQAIRNLGLDVQQLLKLSPVERLQAVGRALNDFAGDNKLNYNLLLLGKNMRETAAFMKELGDAGPLVATATARDAEEAEKFNKELFALQKTIVDASRSLAGPMLSSLNETIAALRKGRAEGKGFWETVFSQPIRGAVNLDSKAGAGRGFVNPEVVKPVLPAIADPAAAAAASAASKKAADERLRLAEFTARQIVEIEEQAAQDTADAWKAWEKQQLDLAKERADAEKEQWRQVFDFIDQQQEDAIREGEALLEATKKTVDEWSVFADQAARNIQDVLGDSLVALMEGNFRSIGDLWKRTLDRMVVEALAAKLGKALLGDFGSTGQIGGWAGDLFKWAGSFFGGGRAAGGTVSAGMTYLVGERGPELLHMGAGGGGGSITPNARALGGGVTIHQHITAPAGMDRASRLQLMADVGLATQRAIARNT